MKRYLKIFTILISGLFTTAVKAEPIKVGSAELSFNAGYVSQYVWRGEDQNDSSGAPSFGADLSLPYDLYLGTWTSSASWATDMNQEVDIFGGISPSFGDIKFDLGYIQYRYPGADENNFGEFYLGASYAPEKKPYSFGVTYSDDDTSKAENIEYSISYGMLSITYGEYDTNDSTTSRDYTNVSLSKEYSGFEFGLTYTDVDWDTANTYRDDFLVLSISKSL